MSSKYKVLAPLVQLKVPDDGGVLHFRQFYAGAEVPESVDKDSLQHHLDLGLVVEESDAVADVFAVPSGSPLPNRPPNVDVTEAANTAQPVPPLSDADVKAAQSTRSSGRSASSKSDK